MARFTPSNIMVKFSGPYPAAVDEQVSENVARLWVCWNPLLCGSLRTLSVRQFDPDKLLYTCNILHSTNLYAH